MKMLFNSKIDGLKSWGSVFQSIQAFEPLIKHIFEKEKLTYTKTELCTPGSNAVFRNGDYVVKIYAPVESEIGSSEDIETEIFSLKRANILGLSAPSLITCGFVEDKYSFYYLITEYIEGKELSKVFNKLTFEEREAVGKKLRSVTDIMNTHCEPFNSTEVLSGNERFKRWNRYPEVFLKERLEYLKNHDFGARVFVHGDLCCDNILIKDKNEPVIIDFADAVLAPAVYEHAIVAGELFDKAYMQGYFGMLSVEELTELCFNGLLIHPFGGEVILSHIGEPDSLISLDAFKKQLNIKLKQVFEN